MDIKLVKKGFTVSLIKSGNTFLTANRGRKMYHLTHSTPESYTELSVKTFKALEKLIEARIKMFNHSLLNI